MSAFTLPQSAVAVAIRAARCCGCHSPVVVPSDALVSILCGACRRSQAEAEARRLIADLKALREGTGVFADLRAEERAEQLARLVTTADNDRLIELTSVAADEIARRLGSDEPDPVERQRIELEDEQEHRERTMAREAAEAERDGERWDAFA